MESQNPVTPTDPVSTTVPPSVEENLNPIYHLKHAWKLFTTRWTTFIGVSLLYFLSLIPLLLLMGGVMFYLYYILGRGDFELFIPYLPVLAVLIIIGISGILLLSFLSQLAMLIAVVGSDQNVTAVAAYKQALRKFLPYSMFSFLLGVIVLGAYLFFLLPGIVFGIWFSFAAIIFLTENEKSFPALLKSREYVRGHYVEVFVCMFFYWLFTMIISYGPSLIVSLLTGGNERADMYLQLLMVPVNLIIGPLSLLYTYSIFTSLKRMKKVPMTLTRKLPYVVTAALGYGVMLLLFFSLASAILPRISDYIESKYKRTDAVEETSNNQTTNSVEETLYSKQYAQANNTQRRSSVMMLLNGVNQYGADKRGQLPAKITNTPTEIASDGVDLCSDLVPDYLAALPTDPSVGKENISDCTKPYATGYYISVVAGVVTVTAPFAELGINIEESR